jgi:hypothetical protein
VPTLPEQIPTKFPPKLASAEGPVGGLYLTLSKVFEYEAERDSAYEESLAVHLSNSGSTPFFGWSSLLQDTSVAYGRFLDAFNSFIQEGSGPIPESRSPSLPSPKTSP